MNDRYRELKNEYDDVGRQIRELHQKQSKIRDLMEEACTHEDTFKVESDPFLVEMGVEDRETKFKCRDCYRYFTKEELDEIRKEAKGDEI